MPRPKANREGANITAAESTKQYMLDGIRYVCENFKRRLPGTQSERDAQAYFKQELEGYSDEVIMEDFSLHPGAFMGWIIPAILFFFASVALYLFSNGNAVLAVLGAVLPIIAVLVFIFQFVFYRSFVDFLFPKKISRNVYATRKPSGEVKRRIIFGGHTDAAHEWTLAWWGGKALLAAGMAGAVAGLFVAIMANIANATYTLALNIYGLDDFASKWQGGWLIWTILLLVTMIPGSLMFFFVNYRQVCDGANDNLSANYIAMCMLKEMHDGDVRFEHTEIGCLLTGSEEAGLRGAKAFAKAHMDMLSDPEVETVFISLDTMREIEELRVCNFGCNGTVRNDPAVGGLIRDAAKACGVDMPDTEWYPGAIDAEAFSMYGLRASGFTGVSHDVEKYYHTRMDTADNLDVDCLALSLNICKEAARIFDEKGC